MKKGIVIFALVLVFASFVFADDSSEPNAISQNVGEGIEGLAKGTDSFGELFNKNNLTELKNFEDKIVMPDWVLKVARFVFNIEGMEIISVQYLIVLVLVFVIILTMIVGVMGFTPLHRPPSEIFLFNFNPDYIVGLIVTLLVALSGGINYVVGDWFFSLKVYDDLVEKIGDWNIVVVIFCFIGLFMVIRYLFDKIRNKVRLDSAEIKGEQVNFLNETAKINAESVEELTKRK